MKPAPPVTKIFTRVIYLDVPATPLIGTAFICATPDMELPAAVPEDMAYSR
jgi:hypothetical protein